MSDRIRYRLLQMTLICLCLVHDLAPGLAASEAIATETTTRTTPARANLAALVRRPPLGLTKLSQPPSEPQIRLGRRLFFDRRLSADDSSSCGTCHIPEQAFTRNESSTPTGIEGSRVLRNAPSLYNVAYRKRLFLDGRETSLETQAWAPLLAADEMGNGSRQAVLDKIAAIDGYPQAFTRAFAEGLNAATLGAALAAYQRALLSANSAFDRWYYGGEMNALNASAKHGFALFIGSGCADCHRFDHRGAQFTDDDLHNIGVGFASARRDRQLLTTAVEPPDHSDPGLQAITGKEADRWHFRTPSLRNVALTGPYMHDGSIASLPAVIDFYNRGGAGDPAADPRITPLGLTLQERQNLLEFLRSLTSDNVDALAADARTAAMAKRDSLR